MDNKQLEKKLAEIGAELSKLENAVLTRLNAIADNLDELTKILDENKLIRARTLPCMTKMYETVFQSYTKRFT